MDDAMLELDTPPRRRIDHQEAPSTNVALAAIATAVPRYVLRQEDVMRRVRALFEERHVDIDRLLPAFGNAGIETRHSCVPIEWYQSPSDWKSRNALFIDNAVALMAEATESCLTQAGVSIGSVDAIVAVSTTGVATPSLDARLMERLPFRRDVARLPVFGLGCAGGVLGLSRSAAMAQARPGSKVLCVVAELCGLTFRANDPSKSNLIATALFGDGAAAVLLESSAAGTSPNSGLINLGAQGEHTWPNSLGVMGWDVENDGLGVLFSRDIPALIREHMRPAADDFLARHGLNRSDIDGYVCHPGGAKVVAALEEVFDQGDGGLKEARSVLRDFGNMSAVTVLFVLERMRKAGMKGRYLMTALGPGFTVGFQILEA